MGKELTFADLPIGALFVFDRGSAYFNCKVSIDHFCNLTSLEVRSVNCFHDDIRTMVFPVTPKLITLGDLKPGTKFRYTQLDDTYIAGIKSTQGKERVVWNIDLADSFSHAQSRTVTIIPEPELVEKPPRILLDDVPFGDSFYFCDDIYRKISADPTNGQSPHFPNRFFCIKQGDDEQTEALLPGDMFVHPSDGARA